MHDCTELRKAETSIILQQLIQLRAVVATEH